MPTELKILLLKAVVKIRKPSLSSFITACNGTLIKCKEYFLFAIINPIEPYIVGKIVIKNEYKYISADDFTKIKIQITLKLLAIIVVKDIYFISEIP